MEDQNLSLAHGAEANRQEELYRLLVNQTQNAIYVSDVNTYALLYLNATAVRLLNADEQDYCGKKCYEYLFGRSEPCPFCKIREMNREKFLERTVYIEALQRHCHLRGKLLDWCGTQAHVEYIMDVTEQTVAQAQLKETQDLLTAAVTNSNITVWEYDPLQRIITRAFNFKEAYALDGVPVNVPDALVETGFVHPQSVDDFRELYREAARGNRNAQRDILFQNADRSGCRWERVIFTPVIDENGRHVKSIGTAMDITEQKNLEESMLELENLRAKSPDGIMLNISQNRVDTVYSIMESIQGYEYGNMTALFEECARQMPDEEQRRAYSALFNRESLLYSYSMGRAEQFVEARCRYRGNEYRTMQIHIRLTKNPQTGDIIGYSYLIDVDDQRTLEAIMDKVALDHFEFMILVNIGDNSARMITNPTAATQTAPASYPDYENGIRVFCEHFVAEEQRAHCMEQMSIEAVVNGLKDRPNYVVMKNIVIWIGSTGRSAASGRCC